MDTLWTTDLAEKATDKYQFIVVTPIGLPRVNVTDIKTIWVLYPDFIFNTSFRVAGKKEDVIEQMSNVGYDEEQMVEIIKNIDENSITNENFESLMNDDEYLVYDFELAGYEQWKEQLLESQKGVKGLTLMELLKMINPHMSMVEEKKVVPRIPISTSKTVKQSPSPTKGKVGRKSTALQEKIDTLPDDKIINVSKITATGTGTTTGIRRTKTSLFVAPNLPITSNNLERVLIAIELLGGEDEHSEDVQAAREFRWKDGGSSPKITSTPTTSTTKKLIPQSKTVVPEAQQPQKKNLLPPSAGKRPSTLVSGISIPDNSSI